MKLGDFGISKFIENDIIKEDHTINIGTKEYMSPELFSTQSIINESIDIWFFFLNKVQLSDLSFNIFFYFRAFGCVIYECGPWSGYEQAKKKMGDDFNEIPDLIVDAKISQLSILYKK